MNSKETKKDSKYVHLTYPYDRPGPGHQKDPKLDLDRYIKPFNYAFPTVQNLSSILWKNITSSTVSSGGSSNGAVLLQTVEGNVVVKGPTNPALEYFASLFFKELKIHCPNIRVVQHSDSEFKTVLDAVQKATYFDNTIKYKARQILDRPFLFLEEYIPFQKIHQLGEKRAKICFDPNYPEGRDRLIRLGIIYAADSLLNIRDRYPLIWGNTGNVENILINFETNYINTTEELYDQNNVDLKMTFLSPIDNRPLMLGKATEVSLEAYTLYLAEFERLVRYVFDGLRPVKEGRTNAFDSSTKRFDYVSLSSTFIYNQTSIDIKTLGEMQILLGLVCGFVNIHHMGMKRIERMKKKTLNVLKSDWKNIWKDDWNLIRLEIIKEQMKIIEKYIKVNEDIIAWVATITLNNYYLIFEKIENDDGEDPSLILNDGKSYIDGVDSNNNVGMGEGDEWLQGKLYEHFGITQKMSNQHQGPVRQSQQQRGNDPNASTAGGEGSNVRGSQYLNQSGYPNMKYMPNEGFDPEQTQQMQQMNNQQQNKGDPRSSINANNVSQTNIKNTENAQNNRSKSPVEKSPEKPPENKPEEKPEDKSKKKKRFGFF